MIKKDCAYCKHVCDGEDFFKNMDELTRRQNNKFMKQGNFRYCKKFKYDKKKYLQFKSNISEEQKDILGWRDIFEWEWK
jgi:hypothetical protein